METAEDIRQAIDALMHSSETIQLAEQLAANATGVKEAAVCFNAAEKVKEVPVVKFGISL